MKFRSNIHGGYVVFGLVLVLLLWPIRIAIQYRKLGGPCMGRGSHGMLDAEPELTGSLVVYSMASMALCFFC